jgi:hypothetical protein
MARTRRFSGSVTDFYFDTGGRRGASTLQLYRRNKRRPDEPFIMRFYTSDRHIMRRLESFLVGRGRPEQDAYKVFLEVDYLDDGAEPYELIGFTEVSPDDR